ncbi:MAG: Flp pilus assembly protein RcpC/CpaB [Actinomycetota bacterium]|jgi:Flp pilus assembly protein CpaB
MSATPKKRSTILVAVGAGVFVVGSGLAALATRDTGSTHNARSDTPLAAAAPAGSVAGAAQGAASFVIPTDHQAMAVQVPFVQGLAGYAKAGDLVNVYGFVKDNPATTPVGDAMAKLILQKVKVLAINPGADGGNATYILAVSTNDAEAINYLSSNEKVWLTLARDDQGTLVPHGFQASNV